MIDYFKGLLMTHYLDIFMSVKNVGLNGLNTYLNTLRLIIALKRP